MRRAGNTKRPLRPSPLVGHLLAFRRDRVGLLRACAEAPGDVVELRIRTPTYVLKRAEDVRHVFRHDQDAYTKAPRLTSRRATKIAGPTVLTMEDAAHREARQRVQPSFGRAAIAALSPTIVRGVDRMLDGWRDGAEIDLSAEMLGFARRNIVSCVFGVEDEADVDAVDAGVVELRHALDKVRDGIVPPPTFLPVAMRRNVRRSIDELDRIVERQIDERARDTSPRPDLLSALVATHPGSARDEAITLALTGSENVARVLVWTFIEVARQPAVEERLRSEIAGALGDRVPAWGDPAHASALKYAELVVTETMRLWPPNPMMIRVARRDDVLPNGTRVERGAKILLSPYVLQRDSCYFSDPERFDPERFGEHATHGQRQAFFPFGGGPRVCIGQALATASCALALVRVAQTHRLVPIAGAAEHRYTGSNIRRGDGPPMRVHRERHR